jgi:parallel beta-helix repeat protein
VVEINQACVTTGCFSGDAPNFPVSIDGTAGRSYRLTSDLVVPDENTTGIAVSADDVSIDLAGFEIRGPVTCSYPPLACVPNAGSGRGVDAESASGVSVRNGSIRGMGERGVRLGARAEVTSLRLRFNRVVGIHTDAGARVSNNIAQENGAAITTGSGSNVSGNTAFHNGGSYAGAIWPGDGSTATGNTAYANDGDGMQVGYGATVSGNTVYGNGGYGIYARPGSTVAGNTAYANRGAAGISAAGATVSGNSAFFNGNGSALSAGIIATNACMVIGNTVRDNEGFGLRLLDQSGYRENVISYNTMGTVSGSGFVNLGNNACNGTATCP